MDRLRLTKKPGSLGKFAIEIYLKYANEQNEKSGHLSFEYEFQIRFILQQAIYARQTKAKS